MRYSEKQYEKVAKFVDGLSKNHEFFSRLKEEIGGENAQELYRKYPVIYKKTIEDNFDGYLSKAFVEDFEDKDKLVSYFMEPTGLSSNHDRIFMGKSGKKWILETTSGSTGKPFTIVKDSMEKLLESKFLFDLRKQHYAEVTPENGFLLLQPVDDFIKSLNYRGNSADNMPAVIEYMFTKKPKWLLTTTLLLRKMVESIKAMQVENEIRALKLEFIETTSQALDPSEKEEIQAMFGCRVVNQFGCREVWNIAYECPCGKMHVNDKYLLVDIVDEKGKVIEEKGKVGEVIITSFLHKNFPFLKYFLGDHAFFSGEECSCGNPSPVIVFSGGRKKDKLIGTDYYGTEIFRKIMRFIYFKHPEVEVKDVFFFQSEEKKIEVKAFLGKDTKEQFRKFVEDTFRFLIGDHDIVFEYQFMNQKFSKETDLKPEIFKNFMGYGKGIK